MRDAIKAGVLPAALLAAEEDEAQVFYSLLAVTTARHHKALAPLWERALSDGGEAGAALQKMGAVVLAAGGGDAKFRAYVGFVLGLINLAAKVGAMRQGVPGAGFGRVLDDRWCWEAPAAGLCGKASGLCADLYQACVYAVCSRGVVSCQHVM